MKNLICKEFSLVIPKPVFLFLFGGAMVIIPSYPYFVSFIYILFSIQIVFQMAAENKDLEFTAILPIARNKIVLARHITVTLLQVAQIIFSVPFAILSSFVINKGGNIVGMDANFALFGLILIYYSIFNIIFLPYYFKTAQKMWLGYLIGLISFFAVIVVCEMAIGLILPLNKLFDGLNAEGRLFRLAFLIFGIAVYCVTMFASYKLSIKNFEKVSI